jgi:drug/metabolite transporter (DMT)-like permease
MRRCCFYVSTLLVMSAFGFVAFREPLTLAKIVGGILAVAGLLVTFSDSLGVFSLAASVSAVASGVEIAASKRLSERHSPLFLSVLVWGTILIANLAVSIFIGETSSLPAADAHWAYMIGFSLVSIVGFWTVMEGMRRVDAHEG